MRLVPASAGGLARKVRYLLFLALALGLIYGLGAASGRLTVTGREERIVSGVSLPGLSLGGLTAREALPVVKAWVGQRADHVLNVHGAGKTWRVQAGEVRLDVPADVVVAEALAVGRRGSIFHRWRERWQALFHGVVLLSWRTPGAGLQRWLAMLEPALYTPPHNAYRDVETGKVVAEQAGRRLDVAASAAAVHDAFMNLRHDADLILADISPRVAAAAVAGVQAPIRLSRFSTQFDAKMSNRSANIRLAAGMLDGIILQPGEVFSYNQVVGPREKATGYLEAPELLRGDLVTGVGGGVCQVSSTLYNAVLLANLAIVERYKHSTALGYVAAGRDATVSYGELDFRFRNNLSFPIVIRTFVEGGKITISLFGRTALPYDVTLREETRSLPMPVREQVDQRLAPGTRQVTEEGQPGRLVIVTRELRMPNGQVQRQVVSRNMYEAKTQLITVGPPAPAPPDSPADQPLPAETPSGAEAATTQTPPP